MPPGVRKKNHSARNFFGQDHGIVTRRRSPCDAVRILLADRLFDLAHEKRIHRDGLLAHQRNFRLTDKPRRSAISSA